MNIDLIQAESDYRKALQLPPKKTSGILNQFPFDFQKTAYM
ncbi:MAG: hypothetical protein Q7J34_09580 [Bacteroidales bacterium]|nr:hypothetical protein [Bacteroidales bacterium]